MNTVYLDHNSTTALHADVLVAMMPWMTTQCGNATSRHVFGRNARDAVEHARTQVASAVGAQPSQVVFTASGTEANNFAIHGITQKLEPSQVLASRIEHPCVSRPALALQKQGWSVNTAPVDAQGRVETTPLERLLKTPTGLISVMLANNETGAIQDIASISQLARQHRAYIHTDAVQALGKIAIDYYAIGVHAMTLSSHKIGGPLGAGALVLDKRVDIEPLLYGGGQEKGLRSGTENVAAIVGFGSACELATLSIDRFTQHTEMLRNELEDRLVSMGATIFAQSAQRLPNTSFFAFNGIEGETLVTALDKAGFAVASGSACSSDSTEPSHVLLAMGVAPDLARGAVRVSLSISNTKQEIQGFLHALQNAIAQLRLFAGLAV